MFEVTILPVEDHKPGSPVGEEEIFDLLPKGEGGISADHVIDHGIREGGVDLECGVGIQLQILGLGIGGRSVLDEKSDPIADENHEEKGFPLMKVVFVRVEEEFDVVRDMIVAHGMASRGRRWWWW